MKRYSKIMKMGTILSAILLSVLLTTCGGDEEPNPPGDISEEDQVATPTFIPSGGTYSNDQSVMIDCATSDVTIYYTTDNTMPNESSILYTDPISISENNTSTTIKSFATKIGMADSEVASNIYVIDYNKNATPIFNLPTDYYSSPQTVIISTPTEGASIRYTTDGGHRRALSGLCI